MLQAFGCGTLFFVIWLTLIGMNFPAIPFAMEKVDAWFFQFTEKARNQIIGLFLFSVWIIFIVLSYIVILIYGGE